MEILGFTPQGVEVVPEDRGAIEKAPGMRKQQLSWDEICKRAAKVVSFIGACFAPICPSSFCLTVNTDLAGHERYFKITLFGLTGCAPGMSVPISADASELRTEFRFG
jgi:hypothetical protein